MNFKLYLLTGSGRVYLDVADVLCTWGRGQRGRPRHTMWRGLPHRAYQPRCSSPLLLQLCSSALHWTPDTADTSRTTTASCPAAIGPNYQVQSTQSSLLGSLVYQAVEQGVSPWAAHATGVSPRCPCQSLYPMPSHNQWDFLDGREHSVVTSKPGHAGII